jgi:peptide/nickel transport system substrate-binding protein
MRKHRMQRWVTGGLGVAVVALSVIAGPVSSNAAVNHSSSTLRVPFSPGSFPNSEFPFYSASTCLTVNIDYWNLQSRPGYWFGLGASILEQPTLSSLNQPVFSTSGGKTVATITSKNWVWSNANTGGQTQTQDAGSILFWLNLDKAQRTQGSSAACGYVPGLGIPDQVTNVTAPLGLTGNKVVIDFSAALNTKWVLNNELAQIDPMPKAMDITSGSNANLGACEAESWGSIKTDGTDDCSLVFNYLSSLQINNAIWNWSDGPYRQQSAPYASGQPTGFDVQIANTRYSGPASDHAHAVKTIDYSEYASTGAETTALQGGQLDTGFVDPNQVQKSPGPGKAGANKLSGLTAFKTVGTELWGVFYWMLNFGNSHSTSPANIATNPWVAELNQQYIRGAMQSSVNQPAIDSSVNNGYSIPTISAIPTYPKNTYATGITNKYPFSNATAKSKLEAHGWALVSGKMQCAHTGTSSTECGADIGLHADLGPFVVLSPSGDPAVTLQVNDEVTTMQASGFDVSAHFEPANDVANACFGGTAAWEICAYGGWIYAPDYYPSGEVLFATGSGSNSGGYSSATMNTLVHDTTAGNTALNASDTHVTPHTSFGQWSDTDVPFLWQPTPTGFTELRKTLAGPAADIAPNPLGDFMPEFFTAI